MFEKVYSVFRKIAKEDKNRVAAEFLIPFHVVTFDNEDLTNIPKTFEAVEWPESWEVCSNYV